MDAREAAKKFDHAPRSLGEKVDDRGSRKRRRPESESSPRRPSKRSTRMEPSPDLFLHSREPESDEDTILHDEPQDDDFTDEPPAGPSYGPSGGPPPTE